MADNDATNGQASEPADRPDERADEFFAGLGVPEKEYALVVKQVLDRFNGAKADGAARGWVSLGPRNVGGAVRCLAPHPWLPNVFFAGSAQGGLWKSEDRGYSWRPAGAPDLPPVSIGAIAIAPSNPQIMYVGTGEPVVKHAGGVGLYKSKDGGASFSRVDKGDDKGTADHYARIVVDPFEPDRFWAASDRGLWRHDPGLLGGFTLEKVSSANPGDNVTDVALARVPDDLDKYVLLAGVATVGIFRAVVSRSSGSSAQWIKAVDAAGAAIALPVAGQFGRIRLAFSGRKPGIIDTPLAYAVMEDLGTMNYPYPVPKKPKDNRQKFPTYVYRSEDFGVSWKADAGSMAVEVPPNNTDGQAGYSLAIEVAPDDPETVVVGYVNLHRSTDRGKTFVQILDWLRYDRSIEAQDRAQHADQHAIVFDGPGLWVCNDGGISFTADYLIAANPPDTIVRWRKRSYGIGAAQFTAIATHPSFHFMCGGGLQDNGTFMSYGGPTWYRLDGGDGGQMAFDPVDPRRFFTSTQQNVKRVQIGGAVPGHRTYNWALPDVDDVLFNSMVVDLATIFPQAQANLAVFVGLVKADPAKAGRLLFGRVGAGFYTEDGGTTLAQLTLPGFPAPVVAPNTVPDQVSALAFAPNAPDLWLGSKAGMLFTTRASPPAPPAVGPNWTALALPVNSRVNAIVVHPTNPDIVAVAAGRDVYLSHSRGTKWTEISGSGDDALDPGRLLSLAFDPANVQVLFAGTLVGVRVARNLPTPGAGALPQSFAAEWRTYSSGLPPALVYALEVTGVNTLRCATHGRGAYESDLPTTAEGFEIREVMLSIRDLPIDDGRDYSKRNPMVDDPRLAAGIRNLDRTQAVDIRVDAPGFIASEAFAFGEAIDAVEFDETLTSDKPLVGDINHVYVQVRNRGFGVAANVQVWLYFAKADPAAPLNLPAIGNDIGDLGKPPASSAWQLAVTSPETIGALGPGEPAVVKFAWIPPLELVDGVALMAVASNAKDTVAAIPAGDPLGPDGFVTKDRRAALRVTKVNRDTVYIRDGVDDDGHPGGVAWGARSPDIIVVQAPPVGDPDDPMTGPFEDLDAQRSSDVVKAGANFIYVRVFNRTRLRVDAKVKVYRIPTFDPAQKAGWAQLPQGAPVEAEVKDIPEGGWRFATFNWTGVTDPDPTSAYKGFVLLAVASTTDAAGDPLDPYPEFDGVTDLDSFWRSFASAPLANNAAVRALRFSP